MLDATTLANLEVLRSAARRRTAAARCSAVLDRTVTRAGRPPAARLAAAPAASIPSAIVARHDAVEELLGDAALRATTCAARSAGSPTSSACSARAVLGTPAPREAGALRDGAAPSAGAAARATRGLPLGAARRELARGRCRCADLLATLDARSGGRAAGQPRATAASIADGVDAELDRCAVAGARQQAPLLGLEARERERTGIASLKVRYNKVFGYYLEVTNAPTEHRVPADYIRKQTLANAERYVTPELKELEERDPRRRGAAGRARGASSSRELRERGRRSAPRALRALARALGDARRARVASPRSRRAHGYVRPRMVDAGRAGSRIRDGRHPVVEPRCAGDAFVPNDTELDAETRADRGAHRPEHGRQVDLPAPGGADRR